MSIFLSQSFYNSGEPVLVGNDQNVQTSAIAKIYFLYIYIYWFFSKNIQGNARPVLDICINELCMCNRFVELRIICLSAGQESS